MRIRVLGSGSAGNSLLVEAGTTRLLVDAGLGPRILASRLREAGVEPETLSAVLLTHEHTDHARSAVALSRRWSVPLRASVGTGEALAATLSDSAGFDALPRQRSCRIGDVYVSPVPVPHDAAEPVGFVLDAGSAVVGVATDLGHVTDEVVASFEGCTAVVLEANYDPGLLRAGPYPWNLKERIASPRGHLANGDVVRFVTRFMSPRCDALVLAHLSETNNHPDVARMAVEPALNASGRSGVRLYVAGRTAGDWIDAKGAERPVDEDAVGPAQLSLFEDDLQGDR